MLAGAYYNSSILFCKLKTNFNLKGYIIVTDIYLNIMYRNSL